MDDDLARYVKNTRLKRGMALRAFARDVGVAPSFITDIEAGRRLPSAAVMGRMAEVLEVPAVELQALDPRISWEYAEAFRHALAGDRDALLDHVAGLEEWQVERLREGASLMVTTAHDDLGRRNS